jgi:hypothetical protein
MTIPVEIMLRGDDRVYANTLVQPGEPTTWTERDIAAVLRAVLVAVERAQNPGKAEEPDVVLRGISWIVHPVESGVVIAMEIHTASVVAGPIALPSAHLETLITKALKSGTPGAVVH